ncbi:MAG: hypothetical protein JWN48_4080, partial [Myxococcaceae bacterium]|nr:hypothetical protein [Myxococcaceae bacterium]
MTMSRQAAVTAIALSLLGCADDRPAPQLTAGIFAPLGEAMPRATEEQRQTFERGKKVVQRRFTPEQGLGPTFNLVSCGGCHERPVSGGSAGHYRDFLLVASRLPDGSYVPTGKNGVQTQYQTSSVPLSPSDARTNLSATRHPIPFFGTGLLAAIADPEILRRADEHDADKDGISGRPNYDRGFVGRFGRKAQTVSIEGFIRGPLFNHLGITSSPLSPALKAALPVPSAVRADGPSALLRSLVITRVSAQVAAPEMPNHDDDGVADPELSEQDLFDLVSFSMLLAPPTPDSAPSAAAQSGLAVFRELGCAKCHVEDLQGPGGLVPAYSDLLLHDMGASLADGIVMGQSTGSEFRTQPLWGVVATGPYLHDGRVSTLDGAVRAHDGEGRAAQQAYLALSPAEQAELIAFLESLGGRELASPGMLPPNTPIPIAGQLGAPRSRLSEAEQAQFVRGRAAFDRDIAIGEGLGPTFNGDSCRACHFDPVLGGAGPRDVDVIRQARSDGAELGPASGHGSMLHRHGNDEQRPAPDGQAALFERRQTPTLFGLGLVDEIDDAALLALADPNDSNGDGISGRARQLPGGKIGRFGWKSNVPSLEDFVRDGLSNELGLTLPASGSSFGILQDADAVSDPEVDAQQIADLSFFLRTLAPPVPATSSAAPGLLTAGRALFEQTGCAACHVPSLRARDGSVVPLYSDLLLHDVQ